MRLTFRTVAVLAGGLFVPIEAQAQFGQCGMDAISPADAVNRVEWARRCALNKLVTVQGFPVTDGANPMMDYQEVDPLANPSGQNAFHGDIANFEINGTYAHALFTRMPSTQVLDSAGFYQWTSASLRPSPYYPLFGTTPTPGVGSQLYPHPQLKDCNLYTDRSAYSVAPIFHVNMYCNSTTAALSQGVPVSGFTQGAGGEKHFSVAIPEGSVGLSISLSSGTGNADLYVKRGGVATEASYDCASRYSGNYDACFFAAAEGSYSVLVKSVTASSGLSVVAYWNALTRSSPVSNLYGGGATEKVYTFYVPGNVSSATFSLSGGTGDADLYVRSGAPPTLTEYGCRPYTGGNSETCAFSWPSAGTYYVMVRGWSRYSGVTLSASYAEMAPEPPPCLQRALCPANMACPIPVPCLAEEAVSSPASEGPSDPVF
ncbi:PPC domain-containing protein [Stigmatella erecta]|uniref:Pre-peptidase C-terminal domain-containing protein n=1 Tax=Stigmatella erecta TaxID=83460 RepID=A0A1I0LCQ2_9BACT|nr:PPC domain-containing protein [Stigmatella erecta]SEU37119.1 pre-peptidase C-terminal domain-containing protein [Stigmatella erecta]